MQIQTIGVIGAGTMGSGIAQVSIEAGYTVFLQDINENSLVKARAGIEKNFDKMISKGKITEADMIAAMDRLTCTTNLVTACKDADLMIESVFENLEIKQNMFQEFERLCKPEAILASNTSALPITEIGSIIKRKDKVIGLHFMNPVPMMKGLEIIRGQLTSDETLATTLEYVKQIGKEAAMAVDYAGFIVSRLLNVLVNETIKLIEEGNTPEDIDKAMQLCAGHPMGPCKLMDLSGLDISLHGMETLERDLGPKYKPHPMIKKRVMAGLLGVKSGEGFYKY
ncbi:MAG TPA: 3-hydroxyacyl-CoA dehydrogenase family protein [Syntrophomonas sp.]|nr:3-hydroxyacyl-CoA dehydrogenase family protein [Syntrophomonas sp.]